jgi:hypothetical protein
VVVEAQPALAVAEEAVGRRGRHEVPEGGVQPVAGRDADRVRLEDLRLALREDLRAVARVAREDVGVRAVVGVRDPLCEVEHEQHVVDRVGRLEDPHVEQDLAAAEVELGDQPERDDVRVAAVVARAVAEVLGRHRGVDLAQELRPAVPGVEVGQRDVRVDGEELRLLHRARRALPEEGVARLAQVRIGGQQLGIGVLRGHRCPQERLMMRGRSAAAAAASA